MSKFVKATLVLGALGAGILSSPVLARAPDAGDVATQCRQQVGTIWQPGRSGDGLDRHREFLLNACITNGGRLQN